MRWLIASLFAAVLIATAGLGWLFDTVYLKYADTSAQKQNDTVSVMEQLGKNISVALNQSPNPQAYLDRWPKNSDYQLTLDAIENMPLPNALMETFVNLTPLVLETKDHIEINFYLPNHQQRLVLTAPITHAVVQSRLTAYVFTGLFYVMLLLLMTLWLYPLAKRLLALRKVAKDFGEGRLDQRIALGSVSYIRDLEFEFNRMAQRIEDLVSDVKLLSSAVSHDLRTPLASIRFGIDTLQEEDDSALRKRYEQRISNDVDAMIELVETLLNYARLDQAMLNLDTSAIALTPLIQQIFDAKQRDDRTMTLHSSSPSITINADKRYLLMMLNNLIQNALQYAHSQVVVTLEQTDNACLIIIADDGAGIPESERDNMMKPFIRGDKTRGSVKGFGIGLAIVNRVLHWHGGELEIGQDEHLLGAKFTVYLPR